MAILSAADALRATQLATALSKINAVDDVWTAYAGSSSSKEDVAALKEAADEIHRGLAFVLGETAFLKRVLDMHGTEINRLAASAFERQNEDNPEFSRRVREHWSRNQGLAQLTRGCVDKIRQDAPEASEEVQIQVREIIAGGKSPGDLPKVVKCAILGAAMGAAAATLNWPLLASLAIAANNIGCFD